jgi:ATP/maltotriose-dependent transcriptional regulator MalT
MTIHENNHIIKLVHTIAETEALLRQNKVRVLAEAARYSDRWLLKQRRVQTKYQGQIDEANQAMRSYVRRMQPTDVPKVRRYLNACRAHLRALPGFDLRDLNCAAVTNIQLREAEQLAV